MRNTPKATGQNNLADTASLKAFAAVVEAGSFVEGAKRIGLTRSAVGKSISRLEELLGVRLLNRSTRHMGLTADGQGFYDRIAPLIAELEEAQYMVAGRTDRPSGLLRVTTTEAYGRQVVLPLLAEFLNRWPALQVEASFTDRLVDLVDEGLDLAVRFGSQALPSELISRTVDNSTAKLCAAPAYLAKHPLIRNLADLANHRHLLYGTATSPYRWSLRSSAGESYEVAMHAVAFFENASAQRDAVVAGMGVTCLPGFLLEPEVATGRLQALLPDWSAATIPISVVYPSRKHLTPKVRLFIDFVAARLAEKKVI
ncbi:LysR family transcriptional regulator (plasmid) [Comamonadaceae bacterium OTU4NAUVB1]|nr:LysR family transcriptional regulator [Comamonadaceae bacterium OTU4NAUVB1]